MKRPTDPANSNYKLSDFTSSDDHRKARHELGFALDEIERAGVSSDIVAEVMFEALLHEMVPRGQVDGPATVSYLAQLKRFQKCLEDKADTIIGAAIK